MKRLIGLSIAVILGVTLTTVMLTPREANAVDAHLMGQPLYLFRTNGFVTTVVVWVKKGWVNSETFELDIKITSINGGGPINNGHIRVPVSTGTLFGPFRDTAELHIAWDDQEPDQHSAQTYTVETKVLVGGQVLTSAKVFDVPFGEG